MRIWTSLLRRHNKIFRLVGILLILSLFVCNQRCYFIEKRLKWFFRTSYNDTGLTNFTIPNLKRELAENNNGSNKPWYLTGGQVRPKPTSDSSSLLFPDPRNPYDDRIIRQLMYVPPDYGPDTQHKLLLLYDYLGDWLPHSEGPSAFDQCPVDRCILTTKKDRLKEVDAAIFDITFSLPTQIKPQGQIWIIYMLESPLHTEEFYPENAFNWTITYRPDSDLPDPYGKWIYHGPRHKKLNPITNFAANKTRKVAWFASNCWSKNLRYEYAAELQKHIQVDTFGECGYLSCPREDEEMCFKLLARSYKFYLAFENSNCDYYITEKFFRNALNYNVIPIVMGARRKDYETVAPDGSFIHIEDFASPKELAKHLDKLDRDDNLYNQYFLWRGRGEFIDTRLFCRICALLHSKGPAKQYKNINKWWYGNHVCSTNY